MEVLNSDSLNNIYEMMKFLIPSMVELDENIYDELN